jgi:DNA-binding NtrC family response regulator
VKLKVLAVDDQPEALFVLEELLRREGFDTITASSGIDALGILREGGIDLVLMDVMMPGMNGYEVTEVIKKDPALRFTPVILLTAQSGLDDIVEGLSRGADDYIRKPFQPEELVARLKSLTRLRALYSELKSVTEKNSALQAGLEERYSFSNIIGKSAAMKTVFSLIEKIRESTVPVLITGESGTGKELIARAIHQQSPRKSEAFIAQNCSAFNENLLESELFGHVRGSFTGAVKDKAGLFEAADKGTFFLDELGEMSLALQVKLLRVLQDGTFTPVGSTQTKKVDVRIVAATNRNLREMMSSGKFREDLFYRLNVVSIELPPLRGRKEDIPLLCDHILHRIASKGGSTPKEIAREALEAMMNYAWPGNVRELENELERSNLLSQGKIIERTDLSAQVQAPTSSSTIATPGGKLDDAISHLEREMIRATMEHTKGNKSEAARELGISRSNLIAKVQQYKLEGGG